VRLFEEEKPADAVAAGMPRRLRTAEVHKRICGHRKVEKMIRSEETTPEGERQAATKARRRSDKGEKKKH